MDHNRSGDNSYQPWRWRRIVQAICTFVAFFFLLAGLSLALNLNGTVVVAVGDFLAAIGLTYLWLTRSSKI